MPEFHKFTWTCKRWQQVMRLAREHHFK